MHIAICDDEEYEIEYLRKLVTDWSQVNNLNTTVTAFESAEAFLFAYDVDNSFDVLLLDIQMKNMDGIALAKHLRAGNDNIQIIFITGLPDFISEGYEVSALHYLIKPVSESKLHELLDKAYVKLNTEPRAVVLPAADGNIRVLVDEIQYAEVFSHYIEMYSVSQCIRLKISMNELEKLLGEGFFRCHRSYIAGLRHVRKVTRTSMILDDGRELPLSRKLYDAANQAFIKFN